MYLDGAIASHVETPTLEKPQSPVPSMAFCIPTLADEEGRGEAAEGTVPEQIDTFKTPKPICGKVSGQAQKQKPNDWERKIRACFHEE